MSLLNPFNSITRISIFFFWECLHYFYIFIMLSLSRSVARTPYLGVTNWAYIYYIDYRYLRQTYTNKYILVLKFMCYLDSFGASRSRPLLDFGTKMIIQEPNPPSTRVISKKKSQSMQGNYPITEATFLGGHKTRFFCSPFPNSTAYCHDWNI